MKCICNAVIFATKNSYSRLSDTFPQIVMSYQRQRHTLLATTRTTRVRTRQPAREASNMRVTIYLHYCPSESLNSYREGR
jgi:hypothetical protein